VAYSVGYPDDVARGLRLRIGQGLVGMAVLEGKPMVVNDVQADARYVEAVPGSKAELVVPLRRKGRVIGALNLLSDQVGQFTEIDEMVMRQFGAHVAVAIENARLFEHERQYTSTLETLADIGREFASILNLDELLTRIANLTRRVVDYRTFGILLINDETNELEMKVAVRYGEQATVPRIKVGLGLTGYAALHKKRCWCRRLEGSALHQAGRRRAVGAGDSAAAEGSLHRRVRPRESGARRVQEEPTRDPDAARQPGRP
jgi:sigma-B regulation protein RsbU (phosphoserine phosphatase)